MQWSNGRIIEKRGHFAYIWLYARHDKRSTRVVFRSAYLDQSLGKKTRRNELHYAAERRRKKGKKRERKILLFVAKKTSTLASRLFRISKIFMAPLRCSVSRTNIELSLRKKFIPKNVKNAFCCIWWFPWYVDIRFVEIHYFSVIGIKHDGKRRCMCMMVNCLCTIYIQSLIHIIHIYISRFSFILYTSIYFNIGIFWI